VNMHHHWNRVSAALVLALAASASQAHTGHGTTGLFEGLVHPLGLDHLLAMVAVGIWSVAALPKNKAWWGPATFMLSLVASAAIGATGVTIPFLEHLVSLSVVLFGVMLVFAHQKTPPVLGLGLIALAASLHGLAHGGEAPETGFVAYASGFLLSTATLHFGGLIAGLGIKRYVPNAVALVTAGFGVLFGGLGLFMFSQI
jgi:urease accessory protein